MLFKEYVLKRRLEDDFKVVPFETLIPEHDVDLETELTMLRKTKNVFSNLQNKFSSFETMIEICHKTKIGFVIDVVGADDIGLNLKSDSLGVNWLNNIMIGSKTLNGVELRIKNHQHAFTVGTSFETVLRHELGHRFLIVEPGINKNLINIWEEEKIIPFNGRINPIDVITAFISRSKDQIATDVSTYATSSINEFFAECFATYTSQEYEKDLLPKDIENIFRNL